MHEKTSLLAACELTRTEKLKRLCLQALSVCPIPGFAVTNMFVPSAVNDDKETSSNKLCSTPLETATTILDSDLPRILVGFQNVVDGHTCLRVTQGHFSITVDYSQIATQRRVAIVSAVCSDVVGDAVDKLEEALADGDCVGSQHRSADGDGGVDEGATCGGDTDTTITGNRICALDFL